MMHSEVRNRSRIPEPMHVQLHISIITEQALWLESLHLHTSKLLCKRYYKALL